MADEATPTTPDQADESADRTADGKPKDEERIPYSRLEQEAKRAKKAEQELSELRNRLIEFEDRDKSEVERERAARERAESQLGDLLTKVTSLEKGAWVRSAAAELNFHDPEDAVTYLYSKLANVEDEREAKRLVKKLSESKKHLVRSDDGKKERPSLNRMFAGDQTQQPGQQQPPSRAQQNAQAEQQFAEGLREQLSKFLPENSDNWYDAGKAT
ncbi:MAG TPA: hypothetical protein VK595_05980 [Vicinamibacterales bacterium]|nr:hypothetical protein [Vicinamibacterales bacterium]